VATTMSPPKKAGWPGGRPRRLGVMSVLVVAAAVTGGLAAWALLPDGDLTTTGAPVEQFMHVHGLEAPGWADGDVYVSTHMGLIRLDADGQWRSISEEPHDLMGFAANPAEEGVLYSSGHPAPGSDLVNPIGFMVSDDGGATWEPRELQGQADFHAMAVAGNGEVVYGWDVAADPGLHRSSDAGHSWERVEAGLLDEIGNASALAVHPDDADELLATTEVGLLRSQDAGGDWELVLDGPVTAAIYAPENPERLLAYAPEPGEGLIESIDGGGIWTPSGLQLDGDAAGHLAVDSADPDVVYVGTFNETLLRTTDAGQTWEMLAEHGVPAGQ
jgi:hypothetical protein